VFVAARKRQIKGQNLKNMATINDLHVAIRELELAREACPHWDNESDGCAAECCYRVDDARRALKNLNKRGKVSFPRA